MLAALGDASLINFLRAGADFLQVKDAGQAQAIRDFADAVEEINRIGELVEGFQNRTALNVNFGTFTLGGGSDLKAATGDLDALVPDLTAPGTVIDSQAGVSDLKTFLADNKLVTDLFDPSKIFQLIAGSDNVTIVEYSNDIPAINLANVVLVNQNFVVGIVPANFQVNASLEIDPNIRFGYSSRGIAENDLIKGIYVGAGPEPSDPVNPGSEAFLELEGALNVELSVGQDYDLAKARAGVRGSIVATAGMFFIEAPTNPGRLHVDQFAQDCPLAGTLVVSADVSLFADASLNFDLQALVNTLQTLVEDTNKKKTTLRRSCATL